MIKSKMLEQLLRYMLVGGAATIVDLSFFGMLIYFFSFNYIIAAILGACLGVYINFLLCDAFVFKRGNISFRDALTRHYIASSGGIIINLMLFRFWERSIISGQPILGRLFAAALTFVLNFFVFRRFSFLNKAN